MTVTYAGEFETNSSNISSHTQSKSNQIRKLECLVGKNNLKNVETGHMLDKPVCLIIRLLFGFLIDLQIVRPKTGIQHFAKTNYCGDNTAAIILVTIIIKVVQCIGRKCTLAISCYIIGNF